MTEVKAFQPSREETGYRAPPHNFEAEMALLGAILANNRAYEQVSEFLRAEHFADGRHGRIYAALSRLIEAQQVADPVTLKNYFEQDGSLDDIGGSDYLARLAASVVTIINARDYGRTIFDRHLRRQLINLGEDVVNRAYVIDFDSDAPQQIESAEEALYNLANEGQYEGGFKAFGRSLAEAVTAAESAYQKDSHVTGVATGLAKIDHMLGGLQPSELVVLAGRPSMGKTALATNMAVNAAKLRMRSMQAQEPEFKDGAVVGFFSLEMSAEELAVRILAEESGVSSSDVRRGGVSHGELDRFIEASKMLQHLPYYIDDTPALSVSALRTRARRLKRQQDLSLIVVDYLQLVNPSHDRRPENRVQEISEITRALKALAKELDVPVLALSQLSRAVEQREDKRPQLSDLRESGSIEQDADVVMFIYREEYYLERQQPELGTDKHEEWQVKMDRVHNIAEVLIAKNRHGPVGKAELFFDPRFTRFGNLDREHAPDD